MVVFLEIQSEVETACHIKLFLYLFFYLMISIFREKRNESYPIEEQRYKAIERCSKASSLQSRFREGRGWGVIQSLISQILQLVDAC